MSSEFRPELTPREPGPEDELELQTPQLDLTPREPTVSDLATLRRAEIAKQPLPETTGPALGAPALDWLKSTHTYQRGQQLAESYRATDVRVGEASRALGQALTDPESEAHRRMLASTREFLSAPGPWIMEAVSRPDEDSPFTAMIGTALEIGAASTVPAEEVGYQAVDVVGKSLGWSPEQIKEQQDRITLAIGVLTGIGASKPILMAQAARMYGPTAEATQAYLKGAGRPAVQAARARAAALGVTEEMAGKTFKYMQELPGEPLPKGWYGEEVMEGPPILKAEAQAAPVKAKAKAATPGEAPAPVQIPAAAAAERQNVGKWAELNVRQGFTGEGYEPVKVGMKNGRPTLMLEDGATLAEMTKEEAAAYQRAGQAKELGVQQVILDDVAARVMAEQDNPAARTIVDAPTLTDDQVQAIEKDAGTIPEPAPKGGIIDDIVDEERDALKDFGSTTLLDEQIEAEARQLGVDPATGEPPPTPSEKAAVARSKAEAAKKGKKGPKAGRRLEPSQEAFKETYGGTGIGSSAAAAKRTAVANAKWQGRFERETPPGFVRLYQVDGQTFTTKLSEVVQTRDRIQWVDVPEAKAAKYKQGDRYTVPKSTAERTHPARLKPVGAPALAEVEVAPQRAPVVEAMRPAEPSPAVLMSDVPVTRRPVAVAERPRAVPQGIFEDVPRATLPETTGTTAVPSGNVLEALGLEAPEGITPQGRVPAAAAAQAPEVAAGFEAQRKAAAAVEAPAVGKLRTRKGKTFESDAIHEVLDAEGRVVGRMYFDRSISGGAWLDADPVARLRPGDVYAPGEHLGFSKQDALDKIAKRLPAVPVPKPGLGVVLPIRATSVSDVIIPGIDIVADEAGNKWNVLEFDKDSGMVRASRILEKDAEGRIVRSEEKTFHRDSLNTALPVYNPVRGAAAVRLKDGTVVIGSRSTHNSAVVEAKGAGYGHLLSDRVEDVGHVVGDDQRFLTLDEYEDYKRANRIAKVEADTPVDVVGTPGAAPPGAPPRPPGGGGGEGGPFGNEGGFINLPERKSREQATFDYLKSLGKGWRSAFSDHGLKYTQYAAPDALDAINHSAGARGASKFYVAKHLVQPIDRVLGPGWHERVLIALRDSNIQGAKERWQAYADMLGEMSDPDVLEMADNYLRDWFGLAVDHINEKNAPLMKGALTRAINEKNVGNVRSMLKTVFSRAAESIPEMPESSAAFIKTDEFWKAIEAAGEFFEDLKNWNEEVGGHETQFTGPAKTYIPLTPFEASLEARPHGGMRLPFSRMRPGTTMHRTGLSGQYDASVEALARRVSTSIKAIGRNAAQDAFEESGIGVKLLPGQKPPEQLFAVRGVPEEVVVLQTSKERIFVDANNKIQRIPPGRMAFPKSIAEEIKPIWEPGRMDDFERMERVQNVLIKTFLRGWVEPMVHGQNVVAFLGKATAEWYPQAMWRMLKTDLNSPQAIRQLQWMADHGALPNRYGSVSFSKELAAQFGGEHLSPLKPGKTFLDFSAALYGPNGMDIKARVSAALYFDDMVEKGIFKNVTDLDKFRFLDQLGHYQAQTRTAWQKKAMHPLVQPFYTAATTRIRSALEVWGMSESSVPMGGGRGGGGRGTIEGGWGRPFAEGPGGSGDLFKYRLKQHMKIGLAGGTMAWFAGHYAMTGKWPWEDKKAKVWQIPVPKEWARSAVGKYFVSEDDRTKQSYIGLGGLFPVGYTIMRLTGAQAAMNVGLRGGSFGQMAEAAAGQNIATMLQQFIGPALHVIQAAVPEVMPDILRYGRRRGGTLTFETQEKGETLGPGVHVLERLKAGVKEVGVIGEIATGVAELALSDEKRRAKRGEKMLTKSLRATANLILKQMLAAPEDIDKTRRRLREERAKH